MYTSTLVGVYINPLVVGALQLQYPYAYTYSYHVLSAPVLRLASVIFFHPVPRLCCSVAPLRSHLLVRRIRLLLEATLCTVLGTGAADVPAALCALSAALSQRSQ